MIDDQVILRLQVLQQIQDKARPCPQMPQSPQELEPAGKCGKCFQFDPVTQAEPSASKISMQPCFRRCHDLDGPATGLAEGALDVTHFVFGSRCNDPVFPAYCVSIVVTNIKYHIITQNHTLNFRNSPPREFSRIIADPPEKSPGWIRSRSPAHRQRSSDR